MTEPVRLLSNGLAWYWVRVEGSARAHLVPPIIHPKMRTACGRKVYGLEVRPGSRSPKCALCVERDAEVADA